MNTLNKKLNQAALVLDQGFTKDHLYKYFIPVLEKVLKQHRKELESYFSIQFIVGQGKVKSSLTKQVLVGELAPIFAEVFAYRYFLDALGSDVMYVWNYLVFNRLGFYDKLQNELNILVYDPKTPKPHFSYAKTEPLSPFKIFHFGCDSGWGENVGSSNFLYMPNGFCNLLATHYEIPEEAQLNALVDKPKGDFTFEDGDYKFLEELPRFQLYFEQQQIKYSSRMRPVANGLSKITRNLRLAEFFPQSSQNTHKRLRTGFLAGMMPYLYAVKKNHPDHITWIKQFFQKTFAQVPTVPMTLPDIKGMSSLDVSEMYSLESAFFDILRKLPENSWVSMDSIVSYCTYNSILLEPVRRGEAERILSVEVASFIDDRVFRSQTSVRTRYYHDAIGLPALRGSFFLFAAFGLCDLVYDEVSEAEFGLDYFSAWDKLRAVRRTSFGDYVCDLKETYEVTKSPSFQTTLSSETLLITTDNPASKVLFEPFAEQISAAHFRVDEAVFLKNVRSLADLKNKMSLFKQAVQSEMPPNWEAFFQGLLLKIDPLTLFEPCTVFQVPKENLPLIQLLARDHVLKSLIHKAEGYLILVPKTKQAAFKRRLAEFGYLLT